MATSRLSTRRVEWRVQIGTSNKPGQGLVIFEASVSYIPDPLAAGGPRTAIPEPVAAVLDASGYACTPDATNPAKAGERGLDLFTTDSLGEDGGDWTWTARPQLRSVNGIQMASAVPAFSFAVPTGSGSLDLAEVQKVPASPGLGTEQAVALVARAEKAVRDAASVVGDTADEAVGQALKDAGVVRKTDPGIPTVTPADNVLAGFRDALGYLTWLSARSTDGGPTDTAMDHLHNRLRFGPQPNSEYLFAVTDSNRSLTDLAIRASDGQFADFVIDRLRTRILAGDTPSTAPAQHRYADTIYTAGTEILPVNTDKTRAAGWGSSSMQGIDSRLAGLFASHGATYYAGGKGSERVQHTAARMGAVPALVTVAGGDIPPVGAVDISVSNVPLSSALLTYSGTLAGIHGKLSYRAENPSYVFTRTSSGAVTTVTAGTPFVPDAAACRDAVNILWLGKNNMGESGADELVIRLTDACFDWLVPLFKRCLVMGNFADTGTTANSQERTQILATNAAQSARYGRLFIDVYGYLTGAKVWTDTGITPTSDDLKEQALGNKPPSLSKDVGHLNAVGYDAIANHLIAPRITELGWYTS